MTKAVFSACWCVILITVASNPVTQVVPAQQWQMYQQNLHKNPTSSPTTFGPAASDTNPYSQPIKVKNHTPNGSGFDGNINQLLMSKILGNPSLKKILDPNTKLYNQNGQEIQRNPNTGTGTTPNVINNYFIVPPEFFSLNDTKTVAKPKNVSKKRRVNPNRNVNQTKSKTKVNPIEDNKDFTVLKDTEQIDGRNSTSSIKNGGKKRNQNKKTTKIVAENIAIDDTKEPVQEVKKIKRRRKHGQSNKNRELNVSLPSLIENFKEDNVHEGEFESPIFENSKKKTRKQARTQSIVDKEAPNDTLIVSNPIDVSPKIKKVKSLPVIDEFSPIKIKQEKAKDIKKFENTAYLKDIESPVDNRETKDQNENRQTRNSKTDTTRKESKQKITPIPEDIMRNYFPYMYNNFYPNSNYPFNFEQLYQPNLGRNNQRSKKRKNRRNQKDQNDKEPTSNIAKVKLKQKKQDITTTDNPLIEENTKEAQLDSPSVETTTESAEFITNIPMKIPYEVFPAQSNEDELEIESKIVIPKTNSKVIKANLEMPPTMIEDLHAYITPELGREDIVPTIHTNGIINDYYPTFYDDSDSYYDNDESYYLKDLEDDRHFYTTDRGREQQLNRERRKYSDRNYDYRPNLDIKDRINFRRGYKYREKDRMKDVDENEENFIRRPYTHAKIIMLDDKTAKPKSNEDVHFQTPPLLENPDFQTKRIQTSKKESSIIDLNSDETPLYTSFSDKVPEISITYSEAKSPTSSGIVKSDVDTKKDKVSPTNSRPMNDRIETVFAKTRVVKYGVAKDESEENTSNPMPVYEDDTDGKYYSDGHTTFVVAKSLGHVDDYYW